MQTVSQTSGMAYRPGSDAWDEACEEDGSVRPHYAELFTALGHVDLEDLVQGVAHDLRSRGACFRGPGGLNDFFVDPIPRVVEAAEWAHVERGAKQRVHALNAFLADVYGDQRIVAAGVVPQRAIDSAIHHEPAMHGVPVAHGVYAGAAGLDLIRDGDGVLRVLEDNVRTPSGYTYLLAARDVLDERLPEAARELDVASVGDVVERLGDALRAAAPEEVDDPQVAILSDGNANSAFWEHEGIARRLGIPIVTLDDLTVRDGRVYGRVEGTLRSYDVLYRRTDAACLYDEHGRPTALAEQLLEPLRRGTVAVFNAFGSGVADDKLTHAYVPDMIRFYLEEEPLLPSVETLDLADPENRERALDDLDAMVFKERGGEGGYGVTIMSRAEPEQRDQVMRDLRDRPQDLIAQRRVTLSTHPTVIDGRLEPRHIDLRAFVLSSGDDVHVVPGGLTRVAFGEGALVVNSSQNGGGKDTWVLR
jgi:uncharacterized circularly permuted ATP-grasp superfamily protein